jgi:large subunit ribosomal protein L21
VYAVIRTGGKQYRVEAGQEVLVEKLTDLEPGKSVALTDVLLFSDGSAVTVGQPTLPVTVHALCVAHEKGDKVRKFIYRKRKSHRKRLGHRQNYTRLRIEKIERT